MKKFKYLNMVCLIAFLLFLSLREVTYSQEKPDKKPEDKAGSNSSQNDYSKFVFSLGAFQKTGSVFEYYKNDDKNIDEGITYNSEVTQLFLKFGYVTDIVSGKGWLFLFNFDYSNWEGLVVDSVFDPVTNRYNNQFYNQKGWRMEPELRFGRIWDGPRMNLNIPSYGVLFGVDFIFARDDPNNDNIEKVRKNALTAGFYFSGEAHQLPFGGKPDSKYNKPKKSYFEFKVQYLHKHWKHIFAGDPLEEGYPRIRGQLYIDVVGLGSRIGTIGLQFDADLGFPDWSLKDKSHNALAAYVLVKLDLAEILSKTGEDTEKEKKKKLVKEKIQKKLINDIEKIKKNLKIE